MRLRAEELVNLDVGSIDFDDEEVRVEGKGAKTRFVPVGESALRAVSRYLERARAALGAGDGELALFLSKSGKRLSTSDVRRRLRVWERHAEVHGGLSPSRAPAFLRDSPSGGWCRLKGHPGAAGARISVHDPDLHPSRLRAAQVGVRA